MGTWEERPGFVQIGQNQISQGNAEVVKELDLRTGSMRQALRVSGGMSAG